MSSAASTWIGAAALAEDRQQHAHDHKDADARQAGVRFARRFVLVVPLGMALAGMAIGDGRAAYRTGLGQALAVAGIGLTAACWAWAGQVMRLPDEPRCSSSEVVLAAGLLSGPGRRSCSPSCPGSVAVPGRPAPALPPRRHSRPARRCRPPLRPIRAGGDRSLATSLGATLAGLVGVSEPVGRRLERVHATLDPVAFRVRQLGLAGIGAAAGGALAIVAGFPP